MMREEGLRAKATPRFKVTTRSAEGHAVAPNLLDRCFEVERPDTVWGGDITYVWTAEGWLYLAVLMDLCSRRIGIGHRSKSSGWPCASCKALARLGNSRSLLQPLGPVCYSPRDR